MISLSFCKKCNKPIVFCKTKTGKFIPVDLSSFSENEQQLLSANVPLSFVFGRHISHSASCPFTSHFRKSKCTELI